jgi:hypothetical protein
MNDGQDTGDTNALDTALNDKDLLTLIGKPLEEADQYWNQTFGLERVRQQNMDLWLPNHYRDIETYDYQEQSRYADPRIFISTETTTATLNSRVPQLEVMPAQDGPISLNIAKDMQKIGGCYVEKYDVLDLFRLSARNLQIKRGGFIKLRWDPNKGQLGEIVSEFVQPEDMIVDKDARMGQIPRVIAQKINDYTLEELVAMLPDGEQELYAAAGVKRQDKNGDLVAVKTQLGKKLKILEVWYRYFKDGKTKSGVCWIDENKQHVFDNIPNPNWVYDGSDEVIDNFLDEPAPPFIPINYLNDGSSYFDQTTLIEQAASLQKVLDKRGFQIMENADQAGGGLVFNTIMISKKDMAKLVGSPDERIGVKGPVNQAITRVAPPALPNFVIEDKMDARNEIDNVFASHDISRGEKSKNPTLGQDQMQFNGDLSRISDMGRAVERQAKHYYRYLFQMMKVHYTEKHYFVANGEDGQFDFAVMTGDMIENGADVRIVEGSMQPPNKAIQQKWVSDLVSTQMIDPLSVYEIAAGGNMPSPKKMLERLMLYKTDPMAFMGKAKEDDFSREALEDIQILNRGEVPKVRNEYSDVYLHFMNNYMLGGDFKGQSATVKKLYWVYLTTVKDVMRQQMMLMMTQMPTQDDIAAQNQKAAETAALEGQIAGASGQPGQPGQSKSAPGQSAGGTDALAQKMAAAKQPAMA